MSDRDAILGAITDAPSKWPTANYAFAPITDDLWAEFEQNLHALGGRMIDEVEYQALQAKPRWADPSLSITNTSETIWDAEVGFSQARAAIAKSGTLVMKPGSGETARLSSLVPPVNVIVINRDAIVPTLKEALKDLPQGNLAFVTGPSRTADIEGVLVRGVHGPGELLIFVRE
jgi:L-lactate utilization protein LutC